MVVMADQASPKCFCVVCLGLQNGSRLVKNLNVKTNPCGNSGSQVASEICVLDVSAAVSDKIFGTGEYIRADPNTPCGVLSRWVNILIIESPNCITQLERIGIKSEDLE